MEGFLGQQLLRENQSVPGRGSLYPGRQVRVLKVGCFVTLTFHVSDERLKSW